MAADPLAAFLTSARARVDAALERYLPNPPRCPAIIAEAMRYSVFAGGKRLRPMLLLAAADAIARRTSQEADDTFALALPAACAVEMIHTYSLIHDDLPAMDNDSLRRGRPTLHVVYGDGVAILAGDGLQSVAFALLSQEPASTDPIILHRKQRAAAAIGDAAGPNGMVGGQALDLEAAGQIPGRTRTLDADGLRDMHARKTGALIRASAVGGSILAGGDDAAIAAIDRYAAEIGLAFQIVDDILDVEGSDRTLGKSAGKDAAASKPTYPAIFGLTRSRALAAECLANAHRALHEADLADNWLLAIADWVVSRRN